MGTLEKSPENHEFDAVRKRFAKNRDFHVRTAPDHGREAFWHRTRKFVDFCAKIVRIGTESARMNALFGQSLPYSVQNRVQKVRKIVKSAILTENLRWGP